MAATAASAAADAGAQAEAEAAAEIEAESEDDIVSGWCDSDDELAKDEENALLLRSLSLLENKPTALFSCRVYHG